MGSLRRKGPDMGFFRNVKKHFLHKFNDTKVFALVGSSGSGKSYSVDILVKRYDIDLIIDDGLLIKNDHVLAGCSAKQESSEMMAVKRAIFFYNKHRSEVTKQIDMQYAPRILILGTSKKMIGRICDNLYLPNPCKFIMIEDIRSKEEIEYSHRMRDTQGKHIIPLPYIELKKYISEFDDKVLIDEAFLTTKTLVSPKFSRNMSAAYSDSEMEIILTGMVQQKVENLEVVRITKEKKENQMNITVYVRNKLNSEAKYDLEGLKAYLNSISGTRFEDINVDGLVLVNSENIEQFRQLLKTARPIDVRSVRIQQQ